MSTSSDLKSKKNSGYKFVVSIDPSIRSMGLMIGGLHTESNVFVVKSLINIVNTGTNTDARLWNINMAILIINQSVHNFSKYYNNIMCESQALYGNAAMSGKIIPLSLSAGVAIGSIAALSNAGYYIYMDTPSSWGGSTSKSVKKNRFDKIAPECFRSISMDTVEAFMLGISRVNPTRYYFNNCTYMEIEDGVYKRKTISWESPT